MKKAFKKLSAEKQATVLDAAAKAFGQYGYYQANIADICRHAGISNGSLYNYFKNKADLYLAVFSRTMELMEADYQTMEQVKGDFFEILERGFRQVIPFSKMNKDYLTVYYEHGHPAMGEFASAMSDRIEKMSLDYWTRLIDHGKYKGYIRYDIDTPGAAYMLDNHVLLLALATISEHYDRRFHRFFGQPGGRYTDEEKVQLMLKSVRQFLS
jgi:AcrR family transcriptional regulator